MTGTVDMCLRCNHFDATVTGDDVSSDTCPTGQYQTQACSAWNRVCASCGSAVSGCYDCVDSGTPGSPTCT